MNQKVKKLLWGVFAVILLVVAAIWFLSSDLKHIEDTNGPDNYALTTITDANIIKLDTGALNPCATREGHIELGNLTISSGVEFSSDKFTGTYEVLYDNFVLPSDFVVDLAGFEVREGNFKMVVVHEDSIVAILEPGDFVEYRLEDVTGYVSLRIAGESAAYSFSMSAIDYELHAHH